MAQQTPRTPQEIRNAIKQYERKLSSVEKGCAAYHAVKIMLQRLKDQHAKLTRPTIRRVYDRATY